VTVCGPFSAPTNSGGNAALVGAAGRRLVPAHPDVAGPHDGTARHRQSGPGWLTGWRANPNHCPPSPQTSLIAGRLLAVGNALAADYRGVRRTNCSSMRVTRRCSTTSHSVPATVPSTAMSSVVASHS